MILLALIGIEVHRLAADAADTARAAGETRAYTQMIAEDDAARARRRSAGFAAIGLGTGVAPRGFAPLGDIGQDGFVYTPGSIGARRYRD